jgi:hypothetical protein
MKELASLDRECRYCIGYIPGHLRLSQCTALPTVSMHRVERSSRLRNQSVSKTKLKNVLIDILGDGKIKELLLFFLNFIVVAKLKNI